MKGSKGVSALQAVRATKTWVASEKGAVPVLKPTFPSLSMLAVGNQEKQELLVLSSSPL